MNTFALIVRAMFFVSFGGHFLSRGTSFLAVADLNCSYLPLSRRHFHLSTIRLIADLTDLGRDERGLEGAGGPSSSEAEGEGLSEAAGSREDACKSFSARHRKTDGSPSKPSGH